MRVFVTGGAGYVGSSIVSELSRAGHEVTVLTRRPAEHPAMAALARVQLIGGDVLSQDLREVLSGHDALIHNALLWGDEFAERKFVDLRASVRVFQSAAKTGIGQIIYNSSTAVNRPFLPIMSDQTPVSPSDLYGRTKWASELLLFEFAAQSQMRVNVIRLGPVVGRPAVQGTAFKSDRRLAAFALAAATGEPINVERGSGRQFISNSDAARLFRAVLESEAADEVYIGVDAKVHLWEDLARSIVAKAGSKSQVIVDEPSEDPICPMFETTKLEHKFGFRFDSTIAMDRHFEMLVRERQRSR